jgi:type IV fimbrial biogenesis protein FimT
MSRKYSGFTLIELIVVITIIAIAISLSVPSWDVVSQKRKLTNATEQVAALLVVAQSEAQKRNQAVSLAFNRSGNQSWCIGAVLSPNGCDCAEADVASTQFCTIDGTSNRITANSFSSLNLIEAMDTRPGTGDSYITFDPVRGILQPAGDKLQLTFESGGGHYQLRLIIGPTGLLRICNPETDKAVAGYSACTA